MKTAKTTPLTIKHAGKTLTYQLEHYPGSRISASAAAAAAESARSSQAFAVIRRGFTGEDRVVMAAEDPSCCLQATADGGRPPTYDQRILDNLQLRSFHF
ncbi:hypothetical protein ACWPKO_05865 [Coraliomargarita sp. W4R53]